MIEWLAVGPTRMAARVRGVLSQPERDALYAAAIAEEPWFVDASTGGADDHRRARVHYTCVDEAAPVALRVRELAAEVARGLGVPLERIARVERQLTVHHAGDFYRAHSDNQGEEAARRAIAYVYFFFGPRRWHGGELVLHAPPAGSVTVEPIDNSVVMFDAGSLHEVRPLSAPGELAFGDGRFTINGWLWR